MKRYDSIENIKYDKLLMGEEVWAFNKLDGQNFGVKYNPRKKEFSDFTSRKCNVDETHPQFGGAVIYFKTNYENVLKEIIKINSGKGQLFNGIEEITFFFEWYGENSFAGFHKDGDVLKLSLIDIFMKKKGYIEPKPYYEIFCCDNRILTPELIYKGTLTQDFINSINNNDWTCETCQYPNVKEGVVIRHSTLMKGQKMPKTKTKTKWWLNKLHENFSEEDCKLLE